MALSFSDDIRNQLLMLFSQINDAIDQLTEWNIDIENEDDYYNTSSGMQKLAASCMMIEAIGETVNRIDKITQQQLLPERPEIPWEAIIGIRNHIAHGYFNIDAGIIFDVVKNNLQELKKAIEFFINTLKLSDKV